MCPTWLGNRRDHETLLVVVIATRAPASAHLLHYPAPGIPRAPDGKAEPFGARVESTKCLSLGQFRCRPESRNSE
jgi:hypothetical protein